MPVAKTLPWDFVIDLIFKQYGSKEFYTKFKAGKKKFSKEITKEWQETYMNWAWLVSQEEFFTTIMKWRAKFEKKFLDDNPFFYEIVLEHILPLCAPKFFEQDNTPQ